MRLIGRAGVALSALAAGLALAACATSPAAHPASLTASNSAKHAAVTPSPAPSASQPTAQKPVVASNPAAGNPNGHAFVPHAARAVNTSHPNHVIGNGTPASCTSAAVVRAVAKGGVITFSCGPKPG